MFYMSRLRKDVLLDAHFLGRSLRSQVRKKIMDELEGQCIGKFGFVILILDIDDADIVPGLIDNDTGAANVTVWYNAIFLRPFKNEVLDAVVVFASDELGFFCKVGPLQVFVSRHCMPEDMRFKTETGDCWISRDESVEIREGSVVRLRVIGVSPVDAGVITATGTIKDSFLGLID
jgi:DNA-directed RNA polymerase II subunit RPB7